MHNRKITITLLIMLPIILGLVISPVANSTSSNNIEQDSNSDNIFDSSIKDVDIRCAFALSQDTQEGIISPVQIVESGFKETNPVRARTDTGTNTIQNIAIDEGNNWVANKTSIEVSNIKRLYGINGTFENGVEPWTNYTLAGGSDIQIADYDADEEYIICRNVGNYKWQGKHTWVHSAGSEIGFKQVVTNTKGELEFDLRYDFRYATGPIDPLGNNALPSVIGAFYQINYPSGTMYEGYYYPMNEYLLSRNAWYSVAHTFTLPTAWSQFSFAVGLYLAGTITLDNVTDYDDDGSYGDGKENAQNLTVYIDNVEFTGVTVPSFENVELTFHAGAFSEDIIGVGIGTASIANPDHWTVDPLEIQITSNTTVAFTYSVTTLYLHATNSSWTTYLSYQGVSYSIDAGQNADLEYYTYVTTSSGYDNQTIEINFPNDWDNTTIWDPLQNDITGLCSLSTGRIFIPTSLFTRVGWWKITHQSLNYAKTIDIQIFDSSVWTTGSLFRTGNLTRIQVELGTPSETPSSGSSVSINWIMPNGTIWASDSISNIINGHVNSSIWTFGGTNTTAGLWEILVFWNNGTELAFGFSTFELYHRASASVKYPIIETDSGLVLSNQIILFDADTGHYLMDDSVSIIANWSDTTVEFSQNFAKNWWQAEFDTALIENGVFIVIVDISRPYFDPITTQFTIISIFETTMEITNAGPLPINRGLNEVFTVQLSYELLNGTGVAGAVPTVTHSGTANGLSWTNFVDNNNGQYSIDIRCNTSDTYGVTIKLSKPFYYNVSDSFTLIIGETNTELEIMNGTADVVLYGGSYRLIVEYSNSTGYGLPGATLEIISVTPVSGLTYSGFSHLYDGFYEVILTPESAGTFSIVISASILNHKTQYETFTLTASGIPTILTSLPSTKTVSVNQTFTLQLLFQDESFNTIDSATVVLVNPPAGLTVSATVFVGNGLYNITMQSLEIKTYNLLFRATANNYQSASAGFTFDVTQIQTALSFEDDVTSTTVEFEEPYELILYYNRIDPIAPIEGADIMILPADIAELTIDIVEYSGYYIITIRGHSIGTWALTVVANKTGHRIATKQFFFATEAIDTTVQMSSSLGALYIGRSYQLTFNYTYISNGDNIRGATVVPFGAGAGWVTYIELGSGQYLLNLTPQELGEQSVLLTFQILGHETASFRLNFEVGRIPITVEVLQGLNAPENSLSLILVRITETDTRDSVSGIDVFCYIIDPNGAAGSSTTMDETSTAGVYSAYISMPVAEGVYQIQVICEASNYVLNSVFTMNLQPQRDIVSMVWITTTRYYPIIVVLATICVGLVYRRAARKRRIRENKETLAIKRRFDDVRSLLGVIVIHKESGLPVYSKILREGLEETVISAFITAITSFRGEFDIETSSEEWGLIPISDIVRVISTNKLVCAFITTGNPSPEQRERMIQFAKTVGFIFDETMEDIPVVVLDRHTTAQFDALFEDILDGQLLRTYKLDESKKFPTTSCANERIARKQGIEFKLEELASEIASCGLEETRVYKAIMVALENHYLVKTEDSPFSTELLRAPDVAHEEVE